MATPSAGVVFTGNQGGQGDGTGAAAILDQNPDFLPYAERIGIRKAQEDKLAEATKKQRDKNWYNLIKGVESGNVWKPAQDHVLAQQKQLAKEGRDLYMAGADLEDLSDPRVAEYSQRLKEFENETKSIQNAQAIAEKQLAQIAKGDKPYDKEYADAWYKKLYELPVNEQEEYVMTTSPIRVKVSDTDALTAIMPSLYKKTVEKGATTTTTEEIRREDVAAVADLLTAGDPKVKEHYEQGIEDGRWTDKDSYIDEMYKLSKGKESGSLKITQDEPKVSSSGGAGSGGSNSDFQVVPAYESRLGGTEGRSNMVRFIPKNQNMKTFVFTDANGKQLTTNAFTVEKKGDGYYLLAEAYPKEEVDAAAEAQGIDPNNMTSALMAQLLAGSGSGAPKKQTVTLPINSNVGELGNANYATVSAAIGKPLEDFIDIDVTGGKAAKPKGDSKGNTYDIKGKAYPKSEVEKQAKASGMSVQEYIDALNSMK